MLFIGSLLTISVLALVIFLEQRNSRRREYARQLELLERSKTEYLSWDDLPLEESKAWCSWTYRVPEELKKEVNKIFRCRLWNLEEKVDRVKNRLAEWNRTVGARKREALEKELHIRLWFDVPFSKERKTEICKLHQSLYLDAFIESYNKPGLPAPALVAWRELLQTCAREIEFT